MTLLIHITNDGNNNNMLLLYGCYYTVGGNYLHRISVAYPLHPRLNVGFGASKTEG